MVWVLRHDSCIAACSQLTGPCHKQRLALDPNHVIKTAEPKICEIDHRMREDDASKPRRPTGRITVLNDVPLYTTLSVLGPWTAGALPGATNRLDAPIQETHDQPADTAMANLRRKHLHQQRAHEHHTARQAPGDGAILLNLVQELGSNDVP